MFKYLLMVLLVLTSLAQVKAEPLSAVVLTDQQKIVSVAKQLKFLEDPSRELTLQQISSPGYTEKFQQNTQEIPNFGRTRSAYWVKFKLENQSELKWYVLIDTILGKDVTLYAITTDGRDVSDTTSRFMSDYPLHAWSLNLPKHTSLQFYLRATNVSVLNLPIKLYNADAFVNRTRVDHNFHGGTMAVMLAIAVYNLVLFLIVREVSYLILIAYMVSIAAAIHIANPVYSSLAFLRDTSSYFYTAPVYMAVITKTLFTRQLLDVSQHLPWLDRLSLWWVALIAVLLLVTGLIPEITVLNPLSAVVTNVLLITITVLRVLQGERLALYLLISSLATLALVIPNLLALVTKEASWQVDGLYFFGLANMIFLLFLSIIQTEKVRQWREHEQRAKATHKASKNFLTTMSHELRTPMHVVAGAGELLKKTDLAVDQRQYVETLHTSSQHMLGLIDDILDLAANEESDNQQNALEIEPFDLATLLKDIERLFSLPATQKELQFSVQQIGEACPGLLGDEKRLRQVLVNLIGNAIKYTDQGGINLIVEAYPASDGQHVELNFEIRDTGIGIPDNQQSLLFQPFYQVETKRNRRASSSGLGLAISSHLVQQMGGKLEYKSTLNKGSQFSFTLRLLIQGETTKLAESSTASSVTLPVNAQETRILLVDDDKLSRFISEKLMVSQGAAVTAVNSGQAALQTLGEHHFDMVFMDVSMPDMDGYETTRRIRSELRYRHLPIIALTANVFSGERERCIDAGMNDYLAKPFNVDKLQQVIDENYVTDS